MQGCKKLSGLLALLAGLAGCDSASRAGTGLIGDPRRGEVALRQYACPACHVIPGLVGAEGLAGPPLTRWAVRTHIAGRLPNTPDNLVLWLMNPPGIAPGTAMPDLGVVERDAWDMAAYLYILR
jgi:cytochrome c2